MAGNGSASSFPDKTRAEVAPGTPGDAASHRAIEAQTCVLIVSNGPFGSCRAAGTHKAGEQRPAPSISRHEFAPELTRIGGGLHHLSEMVWLSVVWRWLVQMQRCVPMPTTKLPNPRAAPSQWCFPKLPVSTS